MIETVAVGIACMAVGYLVGQVLGQLGHQSRRIRTNRSRYVPGSAWSSRHEDPFEEPLRALVCEVKQEYVLYRNIRLIEDEYLSSLVSMRLSRFKSFYEEAIPLPQELRFPTAGSFWEVTHRVINRKYEFVEADWSRVKLRYQGDILEIDTADFMNYKKPAQPPPLREEVEK